MKTFLIKEFMTLLVFTYWLTFFANTIKIPYRKTENTTCSHFIGGS